MRGARRARRGGLRRVIADMTEGLSRWQAVLVVGPFALAIFGGLIGAIFGGAAAASNTALARSRMPVAVKAVSMTCVAVLAVVAYFTSAFAVHAILHPSSSQPATAPQLGLPQPTAGAQLSLSPQPAATQQPTSCTSAGRATSVTPAQTLPAGVDRVTLPVHSGVTSAHADEVSFRITRSASVDYVGPAVRVLGRDDTVQVTAGQWRIYFDPRPDEAFTCGTYHGALSGDSRGTVRLLIFGPASGGCTEASTVTIYQFATGPDGALTRLNATFNQTCNNSAGRIVGLIRYNATIPTPVPSLPSSARPVTPPPNSGTTSAHPDELSWLSAPGDYVGAGQPVDYIGSSVGAGVGGNVGAVDVNTAGWSLQLTAPEGQQLTPGTYPDATGDVPGAGPGIYIAGDGRGCDTTRGSFTIYQIASGPDGTLTQLNATFSQTCGKYVSLVGFIRFNATIPTPVPVLPASPGA
jgi:hypothetical protein